MCYSRFNIKNTHYSYDDNNVLKFLCCFPFRSLFFAMLLRNHDITTSIYLQDSVCILGIGSPLSHVIGFIPQETLSYGSKQ